MHHPSSPQPVAGFDAVKGFLSMFRNGFSDLKMSVEDVVDGVAEDSLDMMRQLSVVPSPG